MSEIPNLDKLVHICMYFGMSGMLWLEFLRAHRRDEAPLWHAWIGAFFCPVLFSGCVELLQEYCTSYRGGDWLDLQQILPEHCSQVWLLIMWCVQE